MVDKSEIISFEGNRPLASQDALDLLLSRVSVSRVGGELPSTDALQKIFTAALRAPDHAGLKPWRYLKVAGEQREKLGELFVSAKLQDDPHLDQAAIDKLKKKPLRAPLVIVVIASIQDHPKVPEIEQMLSAGASAQNMLLAAHMQGIGAMWRTGSMTYHSRVREGLGVAQNEKIIGFIYMGSIEGKTRLVPEMNVSQYVKDWNWAKRGYPSLKLIYPGSTRFSDTLSFTKKDKCKVKVPEKLQWRDVVDLALSETSSRQSELFEDV